MNTTPTTLTLFLSAFLLQGLVAQESPPFELADEFQISDSVGRAYGPAIANSGEISLVVWTDTRNSNTTGDDIYGVRVSGSGEILDPQPIPICRVTGDQGTLATASNGTDFLVAWEDKRDGTTDIYGTLVSASGEVLFEDSIPIGVEENGQRRPSVASNGADFLVVWADYRNTPGGQNVNDIYGTQISAAGEVLGEAGFGVTTWFTLYHVNDPAVASDGSDYFVAWEREIKTTETDYDVLGTRVTSGGLVPEAIPTLIDGAPDWQTNPSIGHDGTGYVIAYEDGRISDDIKVTRVSNDGVLLDPNPLLTLDFGERETTPSLASNGNEFLVLWTVLRGVQHGESQHDVYGALVDSHGGIQDQAAIPFVTATGRQIAPIVASVGKGFLAVWSDYRTEPPRIYGRVYAPPAAEIILSAPEPTQDGGFQFTVQAVPGLNCAIESTSDFQQWTEVMRFDSSSGEESITVDPGEADAKFYRAVQATP